MRNMLAAALVLAVALSAPAQQDRRKSMAEQPVKKALAASSDKIDLPETTGLAWHEGLEAVVNRGKPIVLLQLLGRFDDVFC